MKNKAIVFTKSFTILFACIAVFIAMGFLSFSLPNNTIRKNIKESHEIFVEENGFYFRPFFGINSKISQTTTIDNFTDSIILGIAYDKADDFEDTLIKRVAGNKYYYDNEQGPIVGLEKLINEDSKTNMEYTRYWFGTSIIIRFMLLFCNLQGIRLINLFIACILIFIVLYLMSKKIGKEFSMGFLISIFFMGIITIPVSLQYFPVFCISMCTIIGILLKYEKYKNTSKIYYIFVIVGALTSFFDLLSYPLVTLGLPLIILLTLNNLERKISIKDNLLTIIKIAVIWAISYGFSYFMKWTTASIMLNKNVIIDAINQFLNRVDASGAQSYTKIDVIKANFEIFFNKFACFVFLLYLTIIIAKKIIRFRKQKINWSYTITMLIISTLPYLWYIVLSNHSFIHSFMTYKIQAITMLSILFGATMLVKESKIDEKNES